MILRDESEHGSYLEKIVQIPKEVNKDVKVISPQRHTQGPKEPAVAPDPEGESQTAAAAARQMPSRANSHAHEK